MKNISESYKMVALFLLILAIPVVAQEADDVPLGACAGPTTTLDGPDQAEARKADERSQAVDDLFSTWHSPDSPGAAVLVMEHGSIVHSRGYGMANLEHGIRIRPNSVFDIASISKQFGAFAVALLEAEGRIDFNDDIRTYIPELPDFGHVITIRHLIHHTSGLRDWPGTLRMAGWDYNDVISFEQILRMAYSQEDLNFPPGDDFAYSNTGYNLLAELVQRVTGQRYREYTEEKIFQPLGMNSTHFHDDHTEVVDGLADSYRNGDDGNYRKVTNNLTALSSSSLHTSVQDLALWMANFSEPVVGSSAVVERMYEVGVLNDGEELDYAFGVRIDSFRGLSRVSHGGSWAGYRSTLQMFPDEGVAFVILTNTPGINAGEMGQEVAEIYLGDRLESRSESVDESGESEESAKWEPSSQELAEYEGVYQSTELWTSWVLTAEEDGSLTARHFRAGDVTFSPGDDPDHFTAPAFGGVQFERDSSGRIDGFTANSDRIRGLRFHRIESE